MFPATCRSISRLLVPISGGVLLTLAVTGCGSSSSLGANASPAASTPVSGAAPAPPGAAPVENNPPGDIPDNVAYVAYRNAAGHYGFSHPEGWARTEHGVAVTFTDKLNGISATSVPASTAPTVSSAKATDVPKLASSQGAFQLISVTPAQLPAGQGVLIVYRRNSAPDPVTGKVFRDEVQRYEIFGAGHLVDLEMYGAVGSDNVDPFRKISQSLTLA